MRTYPKYSEKLSPSSVPKELDFEIEEYSRRLEAIRNAMRVKGISMLMVSDLANICYLTGFQTPSSGTFATLFVTLEADIVLQVIDHEYACAFYTSYVKDIRTFAWYRPEDGQRQHVEILAELIASGSETVGVEDSAAIPLHRLRSLAERHNLSIQWVECSGLVNQVRRVKSLVEIAAMRESGRIADQALRATVADIRYGDTDSDIAATLHSYMIRLGCEFVNMGPFVATGLRSSLIHTTWKRRPVEKGDPIFLEVACPFKRYNAPMMRTAVMGSMSEELRKLSAAVEETLDILLGSIRAGRTGHDVALEAGRGWSSIVGRIYFQGAFGYSVGLGLPPNWAEGSTPFIAEGVEEELVAGMTLHLPIAARIPGLGGVAMSETVLVHQGRCEVLTGNERTFPTISR
jgi:Xaa-Pro dipeptidase